MSQPWQINSDGPLNEQLKVYTGCFCWMSAKELTLEAETSFPSVARWISRLSLARREERREAELLSLRSTWTKDRQDGTETSVKHTEAGRHTLSKFQAVEYTPTLCELYLFIHFSSTLKGHCGCPVNSFSLLIHLAVSPPLPVFLCLPSL